MSARRSWVEFVKANYGLSERRACRLVGMVRSSQRYRGRGDRNRELRAALVAVAEEKPRYGYRRLSVLLEWRGWKASPQRVWRVYRKAGLALRRRRRKQLRRVKAVVARITAANQEWALDFVHDYLACGRKLRVLTLVDAYTRECLAAEAAPTITSPQVVRVLERVREARGLPLAIRCDNGPELTSRCLLAWSGERRIELRHIQPGRPMQNGHVESFNGRFREECLNTHWFENLADARQKIAAWRQEYNQERPHSSLGYRTPEGFAALAAAGHGKDAPQERGLENPPGFPLSHAPTTAILFTTNLETSYP